MKTKFIRGGPIAAILLAAIAILFASMGSRAQEAAAVAISVKNHQFQPAEIHAPANKPLAIRVKNLDAMPIEFESVSLRVEKVIVAGGEGVVNVRPLAPGRYEFFDDFHQQTRGFLVVQ
jgi:hypothetical protein